MLSYCLKCGKNTESENPKVAKINKGKLMLLSKYMVFDFKDLSRRTASDKFLRDKAFNIAKNQKYVGYQRGLSCL